MVPPTMAETERGQEQHLPSGKAPDRPSPDSGDPGDLIIYSAITIENLMIQPKLNPTLDGTTPSADPDNFAHDLRHLQPLFPRVH